MAARRTFGFLLCLGAGVALQPLLAQSATPVPPVAGPVSPAPRFHHGKKVRPVYDSLVDSTRLTVVTHKGKYFLTMQRPRLTWSVAYPGRKMEGRPANQVVLELRTQAPQVATNSRLVITGGNERLEVGSTGSYSDPGVLTWSHFMRFPIPGDSLARVLAADDVAIVVGGITERMKRDQLEAVRDLLYRTGSWYP